MFTYLDETLTQTSKLYTEEYQNDFNPSVIYFYFRLTRQAIHFLPNIFTLTTISMSVLLATKYSFKVSHSQTTALPFQVAQPQGSALLGL